MCRIVTNRRFPLIRYDHIVHEPRRARPRQRIHICLGPCSSKSIIDSLRCQKEGTLAFLQHLPNLSKLANGEFCEVRGHTTVFSVFIRH
jgi:hypothetical protein